MNQPAVASDKVAALQILLAGREEGAAAEWSNIGSNIEVAKPPVFNKEATRVGGLSWYASYIWE